MEFLFFFLVVSPTLSILIVSFLFSCLFCGSIVDGLSVPEEQQSEYAWLKEREKPEDLTVAGALYSGPN